MVRQGRFTEKMEVARYVERAEALGAGQSWVQISTYQLCGHEQTILSEPICL